MLQSLCHVQKTRSLGLRVCLYVVLFVDICAVWVAHAGNQKEEAIADSVRVALSKAIADSRPPKPSFDKIEDRINASQLVGRNV